MRQQNSLSGPSKRPTRPQIQKQQEIQTRTSNRRTDRRSVDKTKHNNTTGRRTTHQRPNGWKIPPPQKRTDSRPHPARTHSAPLTDAHARYKTIPALRGPSQQTQGENKEKTNQGTSGGLRETIPDTHHTNRKPFPEPTPGEGRTSEPPNKAKIRTS
jgi:hypothetical protein